MKEFNPIKLIFERVLRGESDDCSGQSVIFLNPYSYLILRNYPHLLANFGKVGIDGQLLVKILAFFGLKRIKRVSFDMTSLAPRVFREAAKSRKRVYVIGTTQDNIERAIVVLFEQYPDLTICGYRNGYFKDETEKNFALKEILESEASVIICGMGSPHQERFLCDLRALGWMGTGYTCGGFLHQTASKGGRYYPYWIDRLNLRWAYRIFDEPKLIWRYFIGYPLAVAYITKDCIAFVTKRLKRQAT